MFRFNCKSGISYSGISVITESYNHSFPELLADWQLIPIVFCVCVRVCVSHSPFKLLEYQNVLIASKTFILINFMQGDFMKN